MGQAEESRDYFMALYTVAQATVSSLELEEILTQVARSVTPHWSAGFVASASSSTFLNEELAAHPAILNASNGKSGEGAVFDYSAALGNLESLEPGAMTDAVVWRIRVEGPSKTTI